jgi:predicted transcriptional regulator
MKKGLMHPQEIEVYYIIPTLRKYLAMSMKERGLKQKEIASMLSIEEASVSHYLHDKRGNKIEFDSDALKEIEISAERIIDKLSYMEEMQHLLRLIRKTRAICDVHKLMSGIPGECRPELINCFGGKK